MELTEDLQGLIDRAGQLQDRIDKEIAGTLSYCRFCSERGRFCDVAGVEAYEDRQRLVEIRELLKDLETVLVYLQRMRSWQLVNWDAALVRLEESRTNLIEKTKQYHGRPLHVIQELNECFGNGGGMGLKSRVSEDKVKDGTPDRTRRRRAFRFLISCIGDLLNPWKWHEAARIAVRMVLISVTVSSTVSLVHGRQQSSGSRRRLLSFVGSNPEMKKGTSLDVVYGRG